MRNLSFPHGDGRTSEESSDAAVCPTEYHVPGNRAHRPSISLRRSSYPLQMLNTGGKKHSKNIVEHIVDNRARIFLTTVSLAFLGLFLLVIYRQFGLVVFVSTLSIILMPAIGALIYAKKLKVKEKEQARQRELNRSSFRRGVNKAKNVQIFTTDLEAARLRRTPSPASSPTKPDQQTNDIHAKIPPKTQQTTNSTVNTTVPSIATTVSTTAAAAPSTTVTNPKSRPKLEHRQATLQKITIQLPPAILLENKPTIDRI